MAGEDVWVILFDGIRRGEAACFNYVNQGSNSSFPTRYRVRRLWGRCVGGVASSSQPRPLSHAVGGFSILRAFQIGPIASIAQLDSRDMKLHVEIMRIDLFTSLIKLVEAD